ncbi:TVP38/TMEM64 family protein [Waterburya agarophytonicola K14]|uniref:TVP38/TMEM64 family membrane protein n=1 Tax=Waterburya agarophytonicola KI4 TaxID=2874699 RepID=A0A964FFF6_9CYAN|nr:TVP38/TMEM64 family protein [Waterburya agarophytonicola]MCC0176907.1 TVP38/TMEM64 family protein [Waterburya agarophytonicola KI4]
MVIWQEWVFQAHHWLSSLGYLGYPAFIGIYLLATLVGLPAIFLFLAAGSLYGFVPGLILVSFADTLSVAVCYLLGRTVARKVVHQWIADRPHWGKFDRAVAQKGWKIVFLTRLSPIVPSNVLNYGFSLTKINFWQYIFVSWVAMLPVIALYVYLASVGTNLLSGNNDPKQIIASVIGFVTTLTAIAYTTKLVQSTLFDKTEDSRRSNHKNQKGGAIKEEEGRRSRKQSLRN